MRIWYLGPFYELIEPYCSIGATILREKQLGLLKWRNYKGTEGLYCAHDSIAFKISQKPLCHLSGCPEGYWVFRPSVAVKAALRYTESEGLRDLASTSTKREHAQPKKVNKARSWGDSQLNFTHYLSHCLALPLMGIVGALNRGSKLWLWQGIQCEC